MNKTRNITKENVTFTYTETRFSFEGCFASTEISLTLPFSLVFAAKMGNEF